MRTAHRTGSDQTLNANQDAAGVVFGGPADVERLERSLNSIADGAKHHTSAKIALRELLASEKQSLLHQLSREETVRFLDLLERCFDDQFPTGTPLVVSLVTFEFVSAGTRTKALRAFVERFGASEPGWAFDVGQPMGVGGGACPI
jgi:hypothetical protein